ncbi:MAG TPA: hypothetical protein VIC56_06565 [Gemmatimonadota bacterium]|jgi:hypothetical protein
MRSARLPLAVCLALAALACGRGDDAAPPGAGSGDAPADAGAAAGVAAEGAAPGADAATPGILGAAAEAQRLQVRTRLLDLNRSLLNFHVLHDRFPADQDELETAPEVAMAAAEAAAIGTGLRYEAKDGGYVVTVTMPTGAPITLEGSDPGPRGGRP